MTEEARVSTHVSVDDERTPPKGVRVSTMGWLSFFTMFAIGTDTFLVAPLLPLLQRELDVPLARAGWLVSAYALGYALFALVAGPVSDRHDRRRVILSGLAAFAVFTCACGLELLEHGRRPVPGRRERSLRQLPDLGLHPGDGAPAIHHQGHGLRDCGTGGCTGGRRTGRLIPVSQRVAAAVLRGRGGQRRPVGTPLPLVPPCAAGGGAC